MAKRLKIPFVVGETTLVGCMPFAKPSVQFCPSCGHDHKAKPYFSSTTEKAVCEWNGCWAELPKVDVFPLGRGNCCSIGGPNTYYRCFNMCEENIEEAAKRFGIDEVEVEISSCGGICRVVDDRIPAEWKNHHCDCRGVWS